LLHGTRIWCWDELWRAIGHERGEGPACLSPAAARAALNEAIGRARRDGHLTDVAEVFEWPGFRRRLVARIATWSRLERPVESAPDGDDPALRAQWAIFGHYRAVLRQLHAEDAEGLACWASERLLQDPPKSLKQAGQVVFLDPILDSPARWRALQFAQARARSVTLTLNYDSDPALSEMYAEAASIRGRLLGWGFQETAIGHDIWRPKGLRDVENEVFRSDVHLRPRLDDPSGLKALGAPQGEGMGLVLAREIKRLIERDTDPEEILVLFRRWDDDADLILRTLQAWGLPATAERRVSLAAAPAVAALRLAMSVPGEEWETTSLIHLLRHGQLSPTWIDALGSLALAKAASAIRATRVFRGLEPLRRALDRTISEARPKEARPNKPDAERARVARAVVDRLAEFIVPLDKPRPWSDQCEALRRLASSLGIGASDGPILDALWDALDDHGATLDGLGRGKRPWPWLRTRSRVSDRRVGGPTRPLHSRFDPAGRGRRRHRGTRPLDFPGEPG
jgi:ATP-dependent helicase/nuclease subunit B